MVASFNTNFGHYSLDVAVVKTEGSSIPAIGDPYAVLREKSFESVRSGFDSQVAAKDEWSVYLRL